MGQRRCSRTPSGHSWLTGHQEPMSWSLRSASGVVPEIEAVTRVTQQGFHLHPHPTGENVSLDDCVNAATEKCSTGMSLRKDADDEDTKTDQSAQTLEAKHGDAVWSTAVVNALVDWGIAESFQYSTKTRQLGLSAQLHARYAYLLT